MRKYNELYQTPRAAEGCDRLAEREAAGQALVLPATLPPYAGGVGERT